jgi:hypothetical protein
MSASPPIADIHCVAASVRYGPLATFRIAENSRRSTANLLTRDGTRIAANIAKLPMVLSHIMKEIPRQRHSASRDD